MPSLPSGKNSRETYFNVRVRAQRAFSPEHQWQKSENLLRKGRLCMHQVAEGVSKAGYDILGRFWVGRRVVEPGTFKRVYSPDGKVMVWAVNGSCWNYVGSYAAPLWGVPRIVGRPGELLL